MSSVEDLQQELKALETKLSDPEFVVDYKRVAEASKRYAEITRMLESGDTGDATQEQSEVIVEIRAGTGGDEAALFAQQLYEMYKKYAALQGWRIEVIDYTQTTLGGYKNMVFEVSGRGALAKLQFEAGGHRVQRVPETEKKGRVHTSTVTVAILPKAKETDIEIRPEDMEISFYRAGGPGGQNVNKVSTAVRIVHKPSGIMVTAQEERQQAQNKERALEILRSKLLAIKKEEEANKMGGARRSQIGSGERAEKNRTYNFPQDRITDHRINKSWSNIERVMNGNLDPLVTDLLEAEKTEQAQ